jgi:DNA-binding HxlR family transcriptional regulator
MLAGMGKVPDDPCAIARTLGVLGERWTFLILREASRGAGRFSQFREALGVAPDVLAERLSTLVAYGVMEKVPYREPGERARASYRLTPPGEELTVVLAALQQWGDEHLPWPDGPSILRRTKDSGLPVHVGFVDDSGREVPRENVAMVPTAADPDAAAAPPAEQATRTPAAAPAARRQRAKAQ